MSHVKKIIIGAGLSGLYAGYLLTQDSENDFIIIEARDRLGGRIESFDKDFDLGPTWFWPEMQPDLAKILESLKVSTFNQYDTGNLLYEIDPSHPPRTLQGYHSSPQSKRFKGGVGQLISALASRIEGHKIRLNTQAVSIELEDSRVVVTCHTIDANSGLTQQQIYKTDQILIALPPRLAIDSISFTPALPEELSSKWYQTDTWMAAQAKYIATYDYPFWRDAGLSGSAQSRLGPMIEIHDASMPNGKAALFGFIGVDVKTRHSFNSNQLMQLCRDQLVRLFGSRATDIKTEALKDWSKEAFTATTADFKLSQHSAAPPNSVTSSLWSNRVLGIGSEWSDRFPGYLAGSIDAVNKVLQKKKSI